MTPCTNAGKFSEDNKITVKNLKENMEQICSYEWSYHPFK